SACSSRTWSPRCWILARERREMTTGIIDIAATEEAGGPEVHGAPRRLIRAVLGNRKAAVGALILLVIAFVAAFPGLIAPDDPHAALYASSAAPSSNHLLGTTQLGQDVFSQLIWSTRLTLVVTLIVSVIAT